jgi:hypothetical protein
VDRHAGGGGTTGQSVRIRYVNGNGRGPVGLLLELQRIGAPNGGRTEIRDLPPELAPRVKMASLEDPAAHELDRPRRASSVARVGEATAETLRDLQQIVTFTGEVTAALV